MAKHLMIDIETLGTMPFSVVLSIGAVVFDPETGTLGSSFYVNINRNTSESIGLMVDPKVEAWWQDPKRASAWAEMQTDQMTAQEAAKMFGDWFRRECDFDNTIVWCHGAAFDFPILETFIRMAGERTPWNFRNLADDRTLFRLVDIDFSALPKEDTYHNALSDAKNQARAVMSALASIKEMKEKAHRYDVVSNAAESFSEK